MIDIRRTSVAELAAAPGLAKLLEEYSRECSLPELGTAAPVVNQYQALEAAGILHPIAAFDDGHLVGIILPIVVVLPHYGVTAATVESFFVPKMHRRRGLGLGLLNEAVDLCGALGAKAITVVAPTGGSFSRVLAGLKAFRHSNDVFIARLAP